MRAKSKDSLTTFCTVEGCGKPRRARMLCVTHYNAEYRKPNPTAEFICPACGCTFLKERARASTYARLFCSATCHNLKRRAEAQAVVLWAPKPALHAFITKAPSPQRHTPRTWTNGQCLACASVFTDRQGQARYCSRECGRRHTRREWKERTNRIVPRAVRAQVYKRDAGICQLCTLPVDMSLPWNDDWAASLDHIICQSWTLIPDHSPSNLRLAHRMCNSVRADGRTSVRMQAA